MEKMERMLQEKQYAHREMKLFVLFYLFQKTFPNIPICLKGFASTVQPYLSMIFQLHFNTE
jgi:hypothetical protein